MKGRISPNMPPCRTSDSAVPQYTESIAKDANWNTRARVNGTCTLYCLGRRRLPIAFSGAISRGREAAHTLNSLARDSLALFGTSDGSALTDFLHEFFAGEEPGNESPGTS